MLIVDFDTLQSIHLLDFVNEVLCQLLDTKDPKNVMGIGGAVISASPART